MAAKPAHNQAWELARRQHWVIRGDQLRALGFTRSAIRHRLDRGRLREYWSNAYAVGRADLSAEGVWLAAVFTCGDGAVLSHRSAAAAWQIAPGPRYPIHVSVPYPRSPGRRGIRVHRRRRRFDVAVHRGIPTTTPLQTVLDLAASVTELELERAINEADKLDLVHPEQLRRAAEVAQGRGPKRVRDLLDRQTFVLTDSELERLFLPLVRRAGLPMPLTRTYVNGFKVDFHWPERKLIVETDGLRYHRTPTQQRRDRIRDQRHTAAGFTTLRFTHGQVAYEPGDVERTLAATWAYSP